jgi:hypothetical protein
MPNTNPALALARQAQDIRAVWLENCIEGARLAYLREPTLKHWGIFRDLLRQRSRAQIERMQRALVAAVS